MYKITMLRKHLLILFLIVCTVLGVSGTNDNTTGTCGTVLKDSVSPGSLTTLTLTYPSTLPLTPQISYYQSVSGNVEVDIEYCSGDAGVAAAMKNVMASLGTASNSVTVTLTMNTASTSMYATSAGSRLASPLAMLLTALLASLFFLPKSRLSAALMLAVVCVALSSAATAAPPNTLTITIGLPPQITSVCTNGDGCTTPVFGTASTTSSSTSSASTTAATISTVSITIGGAASTQGVSTPHPSGNSIIGGAHATTTTTDDSTTTSTITTTTTTTTGTTTSVPTLSPASLHFNLQVLVLGSGAKNALGSDFATLAFAAVGMPYTYVKVVAATNLTSYLSTDGIGQYSGIVVVYTSGVSPLSADQNTLVNNYQQKYGAKLVIVGATAITGLSGVTAGSIVNTGYFDVTFAPDAAQFGKFLNQSISVNTKTTVNWSAYQNTPCTLLPVTITDSSSVTPVIMSHQSTTPTVAAAIFKMGDGTQRFVYFLTQGADYIHSMAFASVMVNWISPGGLFIGTRRLTFSVQPDDLFLGSYIWNLTSHTNPVLSTSTWYRITADDLQLLADQITDMNAVLPTGSYITVEWPTNFGGINSSYYNRGNPRDLLYEKAIELIDKFYYLSHTWDHPCNLDTITPAAGYTEMFSEVQQNIAYAPGYFGNKMHLWSNFSMITPCVQGLYNGGALQAMKENNITACVSDESVASTDPDFEAITPYHGVFSNNKTNGFVGIYFVPREALDIDYCAMTPEDVIDEYLTLKDKNDPVFDFEGLMNVQRMYAIEDKIAFRHDPFMMHQTNAAQFFYNDPAPDARFPYTMNAGGYNTSLVALYMQRVAGDIMLYYSLPIITVQMDNLVNMFMQRQDMDACKITTTIGLNNNTIVDISITSQNSCTMSLSGGVTLSGSSVRMETVGSETTAWIGLTAQQSQSFSLSTPIPL